MCALSDRKGTSTPIRRRTFLAGAAGAGVAALGSGTAAAAATSAPALPPPADSGIDHIVLVMMENRSFDHFLGWLPGADGRQRGLSFLDPNGVSHRTYHLRNYQGCGHPGPGHSYQDGRVQLNGGACDGWLRSTGSDIYAIGYYGSADLAFYGQAAPYWTTFDRYFAATMGPTQPNRFYQHSAQSDRIRNSTVIATMPTIWDRLTAAGIPAAYYYTDVPFLAHYGDKYMAITRAYPDFLADCAAGTLPAVSFVDPKFLYGGQGTSADDHPHADIRAGQSFLDQVYDAVTSSPNWARTVLVVNYDEWGGFFDHVAPDTAPDVNPKWGLRGFRVPCLVVSPLARRGHVAHGVFDHTSVLSMIEWRWGLAALTPRDADANNLATVLDFAAPPQLAAPRYDIGPVVVTPCPTGDFDDYEDWRALKAKAVADGWRLRS